jgi:hypothetical protein
MGVATASGATQQWTMDNPSSYTRAGVPTAAGQGTQCAGTKFVTNYDNNAADLLYTPEIDFTGKTSGTMTFKAHFDLETYQSGARAADGCRLLATPDRGTTWYLVSPTPSYNYQACDAFTTSSGTSSPAWGGASSGWKSYTVDMTPALAASKKWIFAWEFATDDTVTKAGFFLDDLTVTAR